MRYYVVVLLLLMVIPTYGQHKCGFDQRIDQRLSINKDLLQQFESNDELWSKIEHRRRIQDGVFVIPVVVHVVHKGEPLGQGSNISDAQIYSAIDQLNQAFLGNGRFTGPNSNIQFAMAAQSPACQPTNGIVRLNGTNLCASGDCYQAVGITPNNEVTIKSASRWSNRDYLNIWVVDAINGSSNDHGIQGFAEFPGGDPALDGVVILHGAFGYDPAGNRGFTLNASTKLGTILIHEVGHSLGLYHSFEGDDYNRDGYGDRCPSVDGCGLFNGDCVDDTPPHRRSNGSCSTTDRNICDGGGSSDLYVHNFMDYSGEVCQSEFTQGQVNRMRSVLSSTRLGWVNSSADLGVTHAAPRPASCNPQTRSLSNSFGLGAIEFRLAEFVHTSGNAVEDGGYVDDWCSTFDLQSGKSYPLQVTTGSNNPQNVTVYCDYNDDGDFQDAGERLLHSEKSSVHTATITVPTSSKKNTPLRLRVISSYAGFKINDACFQPYFGQVEDYSMIVDGVNSPEIIAFRVIDEGVYWMVDRDYLATDYTLEKSTSPAGPFQKVDRVMALRDVTSEYRLQNDEKMLPASELFYRLRVQEGNGRISHSNIIKKVGVSLEAAELRIFPNPNANTSLQLELPKRMSDGLQSIQILDQTGRLIKRVAMDLFSIQSEISLEGIRPGSYFVKVVCDNEVAVRKLTRL